MLSKARQEAAMDPTPAITQRDLHFRFEGCDMRLWCGGDACQTHSFNASSIMFPEGEKFFIESVRYFRDRIRDPQLLEDVKGFIGQEAVHGREHRVYNAALGQAGYDVERLERRAIAQLGFTRRMLPPKGRLAVTIALEHFTAIMADALLSDPRVLQDADPRMAALWRWHAIEETEHKAVAFDVYRTVSPGVVGYLRRCLLMLNTTVLFWTHMLLNYFYFTRRDGIGFFRAAGRFLWFSFVNPGMLRRIQLPWLAYFLPGFHPWKHDNRGHVERWKAAYAAGGGPPGGL
jgi:predicted metal-dependent hydrolase